MKKNKNNTYEMAAEYDFTNGVREKHFQKLDEGYTVTIYSPDKMAVEKQVIEKSFYNKKEKLNE